MPETESHRNEARERLLEQVLSANSLAEIEDAKIALRQWMQLHPEEQECGMALSSFTQFRKSLKQRRRPRPIVR